MLPPMLLRVRFGTPERPGIRWWLPLFIAWLILLPFLAVALVATLVADAVLFVAGQRYHHYTLLLIGGLRILGATRGMTVRVRSKDGLVDFDLI